MIVNRDFDDLWDYNHPDQTELKFRNLLPGAKAKGSEYHLELLTQIARCQGLQRRFEDAHKILDGVLPELPKGETQPRVRYLLERGRVYNSSKRQSEAIPLFHSAWEMGQRLRLDFFTIDAAHMLGIACEPKDQMGWNIKALALAESSNDPKAQGWQGSLLNNIGWTYHDRGEFEKALELFRKAVVFREKQGKSGPLNIARWCVARALRSLSCVDEALDIQLSLETANAASSTPDGFVHEEIGELLLLKHRSGEAAAQFALAYKELSKDPWFVENESKRLARIKELGQVK